MEGFQNDVIMTNGVTDGLYDGQSSNSVTSAHATSSEQTLNVTLDGISSPAPPRIIGQKRKRRDPALLTVESEKFMIEATRVSSSGARSLRARRAPSNTPVASPIRRSKKQYRTIEELREDSIQERQKQMERIFTAHDDLVRQLFHMEKFVTLVGFDPAVAKSDQSEIFSKFREPYDLWATVADRSQRRARSTRSNVTALKDSLAISKKSPRTAILHTSPQQKRGKSGSKLKPPPEPLESESESEETSSRDSILSESPAPSSVPFIRPYIRIIARMPIATYTRPSQRPPPKTYNGLAPYLDSYVTIDDEDLKPDAWNEKVQKQIEILDRIDVLKEQDLGPWSLLSSNKTSASLLRPTQGSVRKEKSHWDFLLEQGMLSSRLIREDGKARVNRNRRVAKMISNYWERLKGQDERTRKEEEKRIRRLAKWTAMEVRKKWRMVETIVRAKQKAMIQAEQEERGKRHLNMILEHSTQMLEAQRGDIADEDDSARGSRSRSASIPHRLRSNSIVSMSNSDAETTPLRSTTTPKSDLSETSSDTEMSESTDSGQELNDLKEDGDVPIEEILKRYTGDREHVEGVASDPEEVHTDTDMSQITDESESGESDDEEGEEPESLGALLGYKPKKPAALTNGGGSPKTNGRLSRTPSSDASEASDPSDSDMISDEGESEDELADLKRDRKVAIEEILRTEYGIDQANGKEHHDEEPENVSLVQAKRDEKTPDRALFHGNFSSPVVAIETSTNGLKALLDEDVEMEDASSDGNAMSESSEASTGLKALISEIHSEEEDYSKERHDGVAEVQTAEDVDYEPPKGTTLSTVNVKTQIPFLLRGILREYQHVGLDWMASLYNNGMNGILADEMGLGKTIQTIALLAYLACEKGVWGPHLIVVPTSVMLNWEMEFKKFLPGFKIMTYYGSQKERKEKRIGWSKENAFHVVITSYQLVIQDQVVFRRKAWQYLILDEAHNIKNFRSQRWQTLLNFNSQRRLLLTGTPLQNNLMELWSLLYFLMPNGVSHSMPVGFANQKEFQEWFSHPVDKMIESGEPQMDEAARGTIMKLHTVLRPFLLRRLKIDVEKQMPAKYEHVIYCRLSKRQRFLYDDFMSRGKTKETLASGNFLSIINCLMQLRKVCNHPDLFEVRPVVTSLNMSRSAVADFEIKDLLVRRRLLQEDNMKTLDLDFLGLIVTGLEMKLTKADGLEMERLNATRFLCHDDEKLFDSSATAVDADFSSMTAYQAYLKNETLRQNAEKWQQIRYVNSRKLKSSPIFGYGLINMVQNSCLDADPCSILKVAQDPRLYWQRTEVLCNMVQSAQQRYEAMSELIDQYACITPKVVAPDINDKALAGLTPETASEIHKTFDPTDFYHQARVKLSIGFPDKRLLQYDCGKLQELDVLLRSLKADGHRALIFTQMTRVLDILEIFLNMHGYRYMRLDGATKVEQRQILTERFNNDNRITVFILSTRSGGLGINLTGADTVIFYDSDWNPCMDRQCQDRCHRIGQTRDVHIYRFVSEFTIEENMLRKANQKRMLDNVVITDGEFTTDYFNKVDWRDMLGDGLGDENKIEEVQDSAAPVDIEKALAQAEEEEDATAAQVAQNEMDMDVVEFTPEEQLQRHEAELAKQQAEVSAAAQSSPQAVDGDEEEEDDVGHVDDYMLKFFEREEGLLLS